MKFLTSFCMLCISTIYTSNPAITVDPCTLLEIDPDSAKKIKSSIILEETSNSSGNETADSEYMSFSDENVSSWAITYFSSS